MAKRKVQNDDGAAAPVVQPTVGQTPGTYIVNFRHKDTEGKPRPHAWLPATIKVAGCVSEEDAKTKLHELLDSAVFQIERARY